MQIDRYSKVYFSRQTAFYSYSLALAAFAYYLASTSSWICCERIRWLYFSCQSYICCYLRSCSSCFLYSSMASFFSVKSDVRVWKLTLEVVIVCYLFQHQLFLVVSSVCLDLGLKLGNLKLSELGCFFLYQDFFVCDGCVPLTQLLLFVLALQNFPSLPSDLSISVSP